MLHDLLEINLLKIQIIYVMKYFCECALFAGLNALITYYFGTNYQSLYQLWRNKSVEYHFNYQLQHARCNNYVMMITQLLCLKAKKISAPTQRPNYRDP